MLNSNNERMLAYIEKIAWVKPIEGADNIELVGINGWTCIAKIGEFEPDDLCVYFEIDSKLPEAEWSKFMENKHYKVKTMKLGKFKVISQGLALPLSAFDCLNIEIPAELHADCTKLLGVTYSVAEDNDRKANSVDKYKKMAQRHPKLFRMKPIQWVYAHSWGKKLLFAVFGKKADKRGGWPAWVVKTDEERVQNMTWILANKKPWIATEKIDGTSTTFTMKRHKLGKPEFYVCSRNVVFDRSNKKCFYDTNVYLEMAEKYKIYDVLLDIMTSKDLDWVTIQGETYGAGIQKRDYSKTDHDFMAFNLIYSDCGRLNTVDMKHILDKYGIPSVPILNKNYILPDTLDELMDFSTGNSLIDGKPREGIVFRSMDGKTSFKCVSNSFLLKYHS